MAKIKNGSEFSLEAAVDKVLGTGFGVLSNEAVRKAAEAGDESAMYEMADRCGSSSILVNESCEIYNPEESYEWRKKLTLLRKQEADSGDLSAMYSLVYDMKWGDDFYCKDVISGIPYPETSDDFDEWGCDDLYEKRWKKLNEQTNAWLNAMFEGYGKLAEEGDADALAILGVLYHNSDRDPIHALHLWEKAAESGNVSAMLDLYKQYDFKGDKVKSKYWEQKRNEALAKQSAAAKEVDYSKDERVIAEIARLADGGDHRAQHYMGNNSDDEATAFAWFKKAAEQGNNAAMCRVSKCYAEGSGVEQSEPESVYWLKKSAEQGNSWAEIPLWPIRIIECLRDITDPATHVQTVKALRQKWHIEYIKGQITDESEAEGWNASKGKNYVDNINAAFELLQELYAKVEQGDENALYILALYQEEYGMDFDSIPPEQPIKMGTYVKERAEVNNFGEMIKVIYHDDVPVGSGYVNLITDDGIHCPDGSPFGEMIVDDPIVEIARKAKVLYESEDYKGFLDLVNAEMFEAERTLEQRCTFLNTRISEESCCMFDLLREAALAFGDESLNMAVTWAASTEYKQSDDWDGELEEPMIQLRDDVDIAVRGPK
jgi:TPR repeat protein